MNELPDASRALVDVSGRMSFIMAFLRLSYEDQQAWLEEQNIQALAVLGAQILQQSYTLEGILLFSMFSLTPDTINGILTTLHTFIIDKTDGSDEFLKSVQALVAEIGYV